MKSTLFQIFFGIVAITAVILMIIFPPVMTLYVIIAGGLSGMNSSNSREIESGAN